MDLFVVLRGWLVRGWVAGSRLCEGEVGDHMRVMGWLVDERLGIIYEREEVSLLRRNGCNCHE